MAVVALAAFAGLAHGVPRVSDYEIFLKAGERLLAGAKVYQVGDGIFPFKYHPAVAFPWAVWALLPKVAGKILFEALQVVLTGLTLSYWTKRIYAPDPPRWILPLVLLCALKMVWRELDLGQINGGLFFGATLAIRAYEARRPVVAGWIAAWLTLTKLNYGLLLLAFAAAALPSVTGVGLLAAGALLGVATASGAVLAFFGVTQGVALHEEWLRLLFYVSQMQMLDMENQGLMHQLYALADEGSYRLWAAAAALFSVGGIFVTRSRRVPQDYAWAFWLFAINFLSPLAWWNQYLLALPMLLLAWRDRRGRAGTAMLAAVGVILVLFHYDTFGRALYNYGMQSLWFFYGMSLLLATFAASATEKFLKNAL